MATVNLKQFNTAWHTLLMMTAESMLSKRLTVLRIPVALFFLFKLFSSHIYCIPLHKSILPNFMKEKSHEK